MLVLSVSLFAANLKAYKVTDGYELSRSKTANMFGDQYSEGYLLYSQGVLLFNLRGNYKIFTATVGPIDEASMEYDFVFDFYVDGILSKTVTIEGGGLPEEVEVDLNYMRQLKVVAYALNSYGSVIYPAGFEDYGHTAVVDLDFK